MTEKLKELVDKLSLAEALELMEQLAEKLFQENPNHPISAQILYHVRYIKDTVEKKEKPL